MKKYLILAIVLLAVALWLALRWGKFERSEHLRYKGNTEQLLAENEAYRTENGNWAMTAQSLEMRASEVEKYLADANARIKDLGVKNRRLEQYIEAGTKTEVEVVTQYVEVPMPGEPGKYIGSFLWSDPWVSVSGTIENKTVHCDVISCDTLSFVAHRVPRRFLFIKYGTKKLQMDVVSANPHTKLEYARDVKIRK